MIYEYINNPDNKAIITASACIIFPLLILTVFRFYDEWLQSHKVQPWRFEADEVGKLSSVKFVANVPNVGYKTAFFQLGLGSCGKVVTHLNWEERVDRYILTQVTSDGERKDFIYYKTDVAGRIVLCYLDADS
ncbi:hypothetical protein PP47_gp07 [Pectobacterium phage PP47]|uniref:Uncharacterized protein n=2 Tax=Pektosvirus TaxID=2732689 RepID=A0A1L7DS99_9CAUD|nr:hypothetical protein HOR48_gp07 [Pectobacterium phage PP81]YP_009788704.1 hypothetical protein HOR52_gp07 [Pectobacterium phage PP47]APU03033.1 hypothetical protein PP81_gp07 [Pectobacterium phage PP81]APW79750.1 hypothetical protein PP47_gp07 [Pectobacterium phage PP47]